MVCATIKVSDQLAHMRSLIRAFLSLKNSLTFKLLTEHHLEFLSLKGAAQARLSLRMSKCHIVGNLTSRLIYMGVKKNRLIENPQHMTWLRMSKLIFIYTLLSRGLRRGKGITINCCKKYLKPQILNLGQQSKTP